MTEHDHLADIRPIEIPAERLARWMSEAKGLQLLSSGPMLEIADLDRGPCLHRIRRAAKAARYVARIAEEPQKTMAVDLAEDLEAFAARPR